MSYLRYTLIFCSILCTQYLLAQQTGIYSHFGSNAFANNPAFLGLEKGPILNAAHRTQWAGLKDAPSQQLLQFGSRIITKKTDTVYPKSLPISNNALQKRKYQLETKRRMTRHSLGGFIHIDSYGPFSRLNGSLQYTYRWRLKKGLFLNTGIALGNSYLNLNASRLTVLNNGDQVFDQYQAVNTSSNYVDAALGGLLFSEDFYIGYSTNQLLINTPFKEQLSSSEFQLKRHHMLSNGFLFDANETIELAPTINALLVNGAPLSLDLGMKMRFNSRYWFSVNYRPNIAVGARIGGLIARHLAANYSYEMATNGLRAYNFGTHEIGLSYLFKSNTQIRHLW